MRPFEESSVEGFMGQAPFHLFEPGEFPSITLGPDPGTPGTPTMTNDPAITAMQRAAAAPPVMLTPDTLWGRVQAFAATVPHFWLYVAGAAAIMVMRGPSGKRRR